MQSTSTPATADGAVGAVSGRPPPGERHVGRPVREGRARGDNGDERTRRSTTRAAPRRRAEPSPGERTASGARKPRRSPHQPTSDARPPRGRESTRERGQPPLHELGLQRPAELQVGSVEAVRRLEAVEPLQAPGRADTSQATQVRVEGATALDEPVVRTGRGPGRLRRDRDGSWRDALFEGLRATLKPRAATVAPERGPRKRRRSRAG